MQPVATTESEVLLTQQILMGGPSVPSTARWFTQPRLQVGSLHTAPAKTRPVRLAARGEAVMEEEESDCPSAHWMSGTALNPSQSIVSHLPWNILTGTGRPFHLSDVKTESPEKELAGLPTARAHRAQIRA